MNQQELILKYITDTKEYGKPSDSSLDYFLESELTRSIINNSKKLNDKTVEQHINNEWLKLVRAEVIDDTSYTVCEFNGGYDFFRYLSEHEIHSVDDLRKVVLQYTIPKLPDISSALQQILKQFNGNNLYEVNQADETNHYIIADNFGNIKVYDKDGKKLVDTADLEFLNVLTKLSFTQQYLGININAFINIPSNNIAEFSLYNLCSILENPIKMENQHNIIDNVAHANESDMSLVSGDSLEADRSTNAESAESSYKSHDAATALVADALTEDGIEKVVDAFTELILTSKTEVIDLIAKVTVERQRENLWKYDYTTYSGKFTTLDLYRQSDLDKSRAALKDTNRVLILGCTGDGKTELAYLLAEEITGQAIGKPLSETDKGNYCRICVASARDGECLTAENNNYVGKLERFKKYIKDNNITEPCVFIDNEIQASDFNYLIGDSLFENFNNSGRSTLLPSNLYIIFTGCKDRDFGVDSQVTQRVSTVELSYISESNTEVHNKILNALHDKDVNKVENILKLVERVNTKEDYPVIPMRQFLNIINGKKWSIAIDESMLSLSSKRDLEELRKYYGN